MFHIRLLILLNFVLFLCGGLSAQAISPWFRQAAKVPFSEVQKQAFTLERVLQTSLSKPIIGPATQYAVKTNVSNWLKHKLYHSHTISTLEKNILNQSPENALIVAAKLQFFFDRDLLLSQALAGKTPTAWDEAAFKRHQDLLQSTRTEVEIFGVKQMAKFLETQTSVFTKEEIEHILISGQIPAFILTRNELEMFPTLSLEQQRNLARSNIKLAQQQVAHYLQMDPQAMNNFHFFSFYQAKCRLHYFTQLATVLKTAKEPRKTEIVRFRKPLHLPFLPEPKAFLTDAERLGKLQFYLDVYMTDDPNPYFAKHLANEQIKQRMNILYAEAETLGIPYEKLLGGKVLQDSMIFDASFVTWLKNTPHNELLPKLDDLVVEQTYKMMQFRQQHPNPTTLDYIAYYRLEMQRQYLQKAIRRVQRFSTIIQ